MGVHKRRLVLDAILVAAVCAAALLGACSGLTESSKDHVEVGNESCVTCHRDEYQATTKPPHVGLFPDKCADCHTQSAWVPAKFSHPFPLIGPHANPPNGCANAKCHGDPPRYTGLPTECVGCHQDDYDFAATKHSAHAGFPTTCDDCHNSLAWKPATNFAHVPPLTGAHTVIACTACHELGKEKGTPQACVACHQSDYDASPYPGHQSFPTTCPDCHTTFAWKPAAPFKHLWPLNGAHAKASCTGCHKGNPPVYQGTSTACVSCHEADYAASPYPGHQTFPTTCESCHTTNAWKPAAQQEHKWPLTGAHTGTPCASCHVGNPPVYAGTPTTCVGCHLADFNGSPYPGHSGFSKTCTDCHTTNAWKPASGAGHNESAFPIKTGPHKAYACNHCHNSTLSSSFKDNEDCVGCHTGQHTRAKMDPKHKGKKGYPTGAAPPNFCRDCHPSGKK